MKEETFGSDDTVQIPSRCATILVLCVELSLDISINISKTDFPISNGNTTCKICPLLYIFFLHGNMCQSLWKKLSTTNTEVLSIKWNLL